MFLFFSSSFKRASWSHVPFGFMYWCCWVEKVRCQHEFFTFSILLECEGNFTPKLNFRQGARDISNGIKLKWAVFRRTYNVRLKSWKRLFELKRGASNQVIDLLWIVIDKWIYSSIKLGSPFYILILMVWIIFQFWLRKQGPRICLLEL